MGEGADILTNYGIITGNNGRAVNLEGGTDYRQPSLAGSRITGLVDGGAGTDTLNYNTVGLTEAKRAALQAGQTVNIGGTLYTSFEIVNGAAMPFSSFATSGGARGIAALFDNGSTTMASSSAMVALIDFLVASASDVGAALQQLSPVAFQGLSRMTMDAAFQTTSLVGQRLTQERFGGAGVDLGGAGAALAMFDGGMFDKHGMLLDRSLNSTTQLSGIETNALNETNWLNGQKDDYGAMVDGAHEGASGPARRA